MQILDPIGGLMGKYNKTPAASATTVVTPPPPDQGAVDQGANVQAQEDALRARQGRAANLMTGSQGVSNVPVATKTLTGS